MQKLAVQTEGEEQWRNSNNECEEAGEDSRWRKARKQHETGREEKQLEEQQEQIAPRKTHAVPKKNPKTLGGDSPWRTIMRDFSQE